MSARKRYDSLSSYRTQYLNTAVQCAELTLPYLIQQDTENSKGSVETLTTPWQSAGAKGVVTLASKLMLALLPTQTSFFKLTVDDYQLSKVFGQDNATNAKTELEVSLSKIENQIRDEISVSHDRVVIHQALKHLVVTGNGLIFMGPESMKFYPLNRYVVDRDGNGNVIEIITKESISHEILEEDPMYAELFKDEPDYGKKSKEKDNDEDDDDDSMDCSEKQIFTRVYRDGKKWKWYQEVDGKILPPTRGSAPIDASPWIVLRFNTVDGEPYGRGRVEEFLGDLKSLEALMQAIVEGSAIAAKVLFLLNPGSTTKPKAVTNAVNGQIIQGKEGDLTAVQVNKALDFRTAKETIADLTARLNEAFLVMQVRQSERTTAEEVRLSQMELEQQLGGLFSLLTIELLTPYLRRKLFVMQRDKKIEKLPEKFIKPTIVAGINALGRGQDAEALARFFAAVQASYGPQVLVQMTNPLEGVKRLAIGMGIDTLNLINKPQDVEAQKQEAINIQKEMSLTDQTAALASSPAMDPSKNPQLNGETNPLASGQDQAQLQAPSQ